jgi:hypothetical protein
MHLKKATLEYVDRNTLKLTGRYGKSKREILIHLDSKALIADENAMTLLELDYRTGG